MDTNHAWVVGLLITFILIASYSWVVVDVIKPVLPKLVILVVGDVIIAVFVLFGLVSLLVTKPKVDSK